MRIPKPICDNLHFLVGEVSAQVSSLQAYIETDSTAIAQRILDRSGYAYNLKKRIHTSCIRQISQSRSTDRETVLYGSLQHIATDLDRIAALCRDAIRQAGYLNDRKLLKPGRYAPLLKEVERGIDLIENAICENDTPKALKIGRSERRLDQHYRKLLRKFSAELKTSEGTEDLISALFIAHYMEQMGDALLNISEAIISANLGQPIDTERYHSLKASVKQLASLNGIEGTSIETVAHTRSGSAISGISPAESSEPGYVAIFKDGQKRKLKEELQGVESWHEKFPGLAPRILSYHKRGKSAALLIEHLAGMTFEQILLHESPKLLKETVKQLNKTLVAIWRETCTKKPVSAHFMQQLSKRLDEVYTTHPEFRGGTASVCGHTIASFESLVERAIEYEKDLKAPFSVYIHGDFNLDNIIYDPTEKRINFIDLHRSRYLDYIQDVSVFLVSNYRLQVLDAPLRRRIMQLCLGFYRFAAAYARKSGDKTFEIRLALALARSFATSTRFILDKSQANAMFIRARYLIERVLETDPKQAKSFHIPIQEIFVV
jgi:phosphate uptake regulator/aminoglycoside phosphotransferase (APT) family kinase protein